MDVQVTLNVVGKNITDLRCESHEVGFAGKRVAVADMQTALEVTRVMRLLGLDAIAIENIGFASPDLRVTIGSASSSQG
jgi:hypothetical protein